MSFASVFHSFAGVLQSSSGLTVPLLAATAGPAAAAYLTTVLKAVAVAQEVIPQPGTGPTLRKPLAAQIIAANHPDADPAMTASDIDDAVAALNLFKKIQAKTQAKTQP